MAVTALKGRRNISSHMKMGWDSIMKLHTKQGFPMYKRGNLWISDTEEIKQWHVKQLQRR